MLAMGYLFVIVSLRANADGSSDWVREFDCDIPGHDIHGVSSTDPDSCQTACQKQSDCKAYTFITGWNRCQLKQAEKPRFKIIMHAAKVSSVEKRRSVGATNVAHDLKGKDLERKPRNVKDAEACANECIGESDCKGFVYIEGYSACWLKLTDGDFQPKRFICGFRKSIKTISENK